MTENQNPCFLSPDKRLLFWRDFRQSLNQHTDDLEILNLVNSFWQKWATVKITLDWDDPQQWPTAWELIHSGDLCKSSLAYMMHETLFLSDEDRWSLDRLRLMLIKDNDHEDMYMVLLVDNKFLLNYSLDQVINIDDQLVDYNIMQEYKKAETSFFILDD